LACSGDGAVDTIAMNIAVSFVHAKLAAIMLGASLLCLLLRHQWIVPLFLIVLVAVHPAWTISAVQGDCGGTKLLASQVFSVLGTAALALQVGHAVRYARGRQQRGMPAPQAE